MQVRHTFWNIFCLAALLAIPLVGGCNVAGYVLSSIPKTVDARYKPPATPMLVLVEHQKDAGMIVAESDELTEYIKDDLVTYKIGPLIDSKKVYELRDAEKGVDKMTITQIGKAVGADQVIYVDLVGISVGGTEQGIPTHGRIDAIVHVVDVKTGKTTFPTTGQAGWPISVETPITAGDNAVDPQTVQKTLLSTAGTAIGRLFHDYTVQ